jgi:hypothetical protein
MFKEVETPHRNYLCEDAKEEGGKTILINAVEVDRSSSVKKKAWQYIGAQFKDELQTVRIGTPHIIETTDAKGVTKMIASYSKKLEIANKRVRDLAVLKELAKLTGNNMSELDDEEDDEDDEEDED